MMPKDALLKGKLAIKEGTLILEVGNPNNVGIELTHKLDDLKRESC
jgi:FixJ family two-component response regulator